MKITVHERKSEDFNYGRVSTPVAQAYKVLDDYFCDGNGKLENGYVSRFMDTFRNERSMYNRSKNNSVKSHSLAWDTLLLNINALLEWVDDEPHASRLTSEQVKNWFNLKGQDYKTELKPLVNAIDKQRKIWDEERASNKAESIYGRPDSKADELAGKYYVGIEDDWDGSIYISEQDFDDYDSAEEWATSELENKADDTRVYKAVIYKMYVDDDTHQVASDVEGEILKSNVCESKKSESIVTDLTNAIQQNQPKVLLSDDAVAYFNDYDEMLDAFEGAYQTIIHIENKRGSEEMWFIYVPDDNIIAIGDFDVDRVDAERAKELMEKFVRGELKQKPGNDEYLGGLDYIAIVDGNNYTSTAFVEGE